MLPTLDDTRPLVRNTQGPPTLIDAIVRLDEPYLGVSLWSPDPALDNWPVHRRCLCLVSTADLVGLVSGTHSVETTACICAFISVSGVFSLPRVGSLNTPELRRKLRGSFLWFGVEVTVTSESPPPSVSLRCILIQATYSMCCRKVKYTRSRIFQQTRNCASLHTPLSRFVIKHISIYKGSDEACSDSA